MEETNLSELIQKVKRQTTLKEEEIKSQLKESNYDYMKVIKNHFNVYEKKEEEIVSINQEIYKQIRHKMDNIMKDYNQRNVTNIESTEN
jgi:vacuolar-type H+-ATPase subunit F/Vma7